MSKRIYIKPKDFNNINDFKSIRWDQCLKDFQKKYHVNYIDFSIDALSNSTLDLLESFLFAAEFLGITCTFNVNTLTELNFIENISKFHRFAIACNNQKELTDLFANTLYTQNKDQIIVLLSNTIIKENKNLLSNPSTFVHIENNKAHDTSYQSRWPYEPHNVDQKTSTLFLNHITKAKFQSLRIVKHHKKRFRNTLIKNLGRWIYFKFEKICRTFLFNAYGIKFLRKIDSKVFLTHSYPLDLQHESHITNLLNNQSQLKKISSSQYTIKNCFFDKMNGSIEWRSIFFNFKKSTVLTTLNTPSLIKAQFSGTARLIGFYIHDHQFVVCTADKQTHDLSLYIDKNGSYTLMKDGKITHPVFSKKFHTPARISTQSPVGLAAKSVLGSLITQQIRYWDQNNAVFNNNEINYSIIVVCTRFSRRLEQLLKSICTQDYTTEKLQIIVCYVPGLDGTDDLLDSLELTYPKISIQRLPFHASKQHHKGFMINQAALNVLGKKVLLTDADIVMPPNLFKILDEKYNKKGFVGAYGRKMLSPTTTAKILLGELNPQQEYNDIIEIDSGELRIDEAKGRPVGFFQLVNTDYLHKVPYQDLPNFEGADAFFAEDISMNCEQPTIAKEITLLHLDHGGSQWYGTKRHM
ncbi:MAG TPA: hypothetical protein PKC21_03990 [Oligoflexia bacterium]|nr:hypothetical protein [Oligoflexia bacterium]HMR24498.1 hypothetical protein [Oligoflexia bacterium]